MNRKRTILSYNPETHMIFVKAPDMELHEMARRIPGARELKSTTQWKFPATPMTLARIEDTYGADDIATDTAYREYARSLSRGASDSRTTAGAAWPPIPRTRLQPKGEWMHQRRAFWWAYQREASMLAITMGGGKTKIGIDLLVNWGCTATLVVSPLSAVEDVWMPGIQAHMMGQYDVLDISQGPVKKRTSKAIDFMEEEGSWSKILLINHESVWREPFASWAASRMWDLIIVDESHRIKSAGSKVAKYFNRLGMHARRRLGLTGTPTPHSILDAYGQFRFLDRGVYGDVYEDFEAEYAILKPGFMGRPEPTGKFKNLDQFRKKFFSVAIQIDDSEQGLPQVVDMPYTKVSLEPAAIKVYNDVLHEFMSEVELGTITAKNAGVKLLRLHQIASGTVPTEDGRLVEISSAKKDALREMLQNEIPEHEPVVVFTRFKPEIRHVMSVLQESGISAAEMSGSKNQLQEWKRGEARVLVAQIQAVKEAVDCTRSAYGIFYSTGISLGDYEQCRKRLHRPPQKRMVRFFHILAKATKDVDTMRSLANRKDVIQESLKMDKKFSDGGSDD